MTTSAPASLRVSLPAPQVSQLSNSSRANPSLVNPISSGSEPSSSSGKNERSNAENTGRRVGDTPGTTEKSPSGTSRRTGPRPRVSPDRESDPPGGSQRESKQDLSAKISASSTDQLSEEEKKRLRELKRVDREVRSHERAHLAAAGPYAQGGIEYEYAQGPNGQRYAVGGSVDLDTSKAPTPEETVKKMKKVRAAALAPPEPSPQDQQVAQKASRNLQEARLKQSEGKGKGKGKDRAAQSSGAPGAAVGPASGSGEENHAGGADAPASAMGTETGVPGPHRKIEQFFLTRTGGDRRPGAAVPTSPGNRMNLLV